MKTKEAIERVRSRFDKWALDEEDLEALRALGLVTIESEDERIRKELLEEIEFIIPHDDETDSEGLILPSYHARIDRYRSYLEKQKEQKPAEWSEEDTCILEDAVTAVDLLGNDDEYSKTHPNLAKAFRVAKDWLKSLPERFNLQPKQEWSDEDKLLIDIAIYWLERRLEDDKVSDISTRSCPLSIRETIKRLKSLRPQFMRRITYQLDAPLCYDNDLNPIYPPINHWKPSEEQMDVLNEVIGDEEMEDTAACEKKAEILESLYKDLKKL